jgi:hypothetical protein
MSQTMNVMGLLAALDAELPRMFTCSDADYAALLRSVAAGLLPPRVEALRDNPQNAIVLMMLQVESLLGTRTATMSRVRAQEQRTAPPSTSVSAGASVGLPRARFGDPHAWPPILDE